MKKIELFERAIAEKAKNLKDYGINSTLFWAYRESIEAGNEQINFSEVIWDKDIEEISESLLENEIFEFTISSAFSSLIPTLAEFEAYGFQMAGLTKVKSRHKNWETGEKEILPAIRLVHN